MHWGAFLFNTFSMSAIPAITIDHQLIRQLQFMGAHIGHTPLHRITRLFNKPGITVYAKMEWKQLSASVKARAAYNIIKAAVENGELTGQRALLDATSGNTGIAYAAIGKQVGIPVTLCLPENASPERKEILRSLGAEIIFTSRFEGTDGAQQVAKALSIEQPGKYFYADQYRNDNNWKAHYYSTALEIIDEVPGITHFVAALGTTGTFIGTGRRLKVLNPAIQLTSLQPDNPLHGLEGWKHLETAIVPGIYDSTLANDNLEVGTEEAWAMIKAAYHYEHLLLSPSSAANLAGALKVAEKLDRGTVVTILPDNADKYKDIIKKLL